MANERRTVDVSYAPTGEMEISAYDEKVYFKIQMDPGDPHSEKEYCVSLEPLLKSLIEISYSRRKHELTVKPTKKMYQACRDNPTQPTAKLTQWPQYEEADHPHQTVVIAVSEALDGILENNYWRGYKEGSGNPWDTVAWDAAIEDISSGEQSHTFLAGVAEWLAQEGIVPSNRSHRLFPIPQWGRTKGSYVATVAAWEAGQCPECGESYDQSLRIVKTSHNARKPDVYKCDPEKGGCGKKIRGITTG